MSAIWKGRAGVTITAEEPQFDSDTGTLWVDLTYKGNRNDIFGVGEDMRASGYSYRTIEEGPLFTLTARIPVVVGTDLPPDRYEITTESQDKSIFEHPNAIPAANAYDSALTSDGETWRTVIENAVEKIGPTGFTGHATEDTTEAKVIRHLRAGVTGWQIDFIVLRRFRQIASAYAADAGKITLDSGQYIYTTAQLNLPATVGFTLPATPDAPSDDYAWGWRKRGQRVEINGDLTEQVIELVFAPWSTFLYSNAAGPLNW